LTLDSLSFFSRPKLKLKPTHPTAQKSTKKMQMKSKRNGTSAGKLPYDYNMFRKISQKESAILNLQNEILENRREMIKLKVRACWTGTEKHRGSCGT